MIEVSVRKDKINITGHAGEAPPGKDVVCASVSVLFQALIKSILDLTDDRISYNIAPGASNMTYRNLSGKSSTLVDSFFIGICMVADEYPDYVRVI